MDGKTRKLWEEVKANIRLLDTCPLHDFSIDITPDRPIDKKWKCTNCGGEVDTIKKMWYLKGVEHGGVRVSNLINLEGEDDTI